MIQYNDYPGPIDYGGYFSIPYEIQRTEFGYEANIINAKEISKEEITKALIKLKYELDDEIAIINNKNSDDPRYTLEYDEYQKYRAECKILATSIIESLK